MSTTTTSALNSAQNNASENIERTMSGLKDGIASATVGMEQAQATARDHMQKLMKTAEDMFAFSQGNFEALAKSSQILATGLQDIGQTVATAAKASMDETITTFKAMSSVKSVKEAMDLQSALLRTSLEKAVSHTSQITDSSMKLSEQAIAPITARVSLATEKFGRVA